MTENMQVDKRKIEGIYWGPCCEEGYTVGKFGITSIELVMENGQTTQIYTHVDLGMLSDAVESLEE